MTARNGTMALVALALGACAGHIGEELEDGPAEAPGPPERPAPPPSSREAAAPGGPCAQVGPAPLRRLTRGEYDATVRDLLGDTGRPARALPPDAEKDGFDNAAAAQATKALHASGYIQVAEVVASRAKLDALLPCPPASVDEGCARRFIETFGKRAFRRPLRSEEAAAFLDFFRAQRPAGAETALRLTLQAFLSSPQFLYRLEIGPTIAGQPSRLTPHELASRLSYFIVGSMPDPELMAAADAGQLSTREEVAAHARRLLESRNARERTRDFYDQWLMLEELQDVQRDARAYPGWSTSFVAKMKREIETFVERVVFDEQGSYATLVSATHSYVDGALARYYGFSGVAPTTTAFERAAADPSRFSGLLTMGGIMAMNAKAEQTSPIHRGRWVREQLMCQPLPPPPPGINAQTPTVDPASTTRQRFEQHARDPVCAGCHRLIDPVGFLFEGYDAAGRWRATDAGRPVDTGGEVLEAGDVTGRFANAVELGRRLAASELGAGCQVKMMFRYAHGRAETEADTCALDGIRRRFGAAGGNLRQLVVDLVQSDAFLHRMGVP